MTLDLTAMRRAAEDAIANDRDYCGGSTNTLALLNLIDAARAEVAAKDAEIAELIGLAKFVVGCFEAAFAEGLTDRLNDDYNEGIRVARDFHARSIWGLVERRLLPAGERASAILAAIKGAKHE